MKHLLIIGARGYGRHTHDLAKSMENHGVDFVIKGFLDDKADALACYDNYPPIISSVESYVVQKDDVFVCALGDVKSKIKYVNIIANKGGHFFSIIPNSVKIGTNAVIGEGCIIGSNSVIDCDVSIGNYVCIQENVLLGHDIVVGNNCMIDSFSFAGGFTQIGENVTIHTASVIVPKITIGDNAIINAGSVVIRNVKSYSIVMGNPAKELLVPKINI